MMTDLYAFPLYYVLTQIESHGVRMLLVHRKYSIEHPSPNSFHITSLSSITTRLPILLCYDIVQF